MAIGESTTITTTAACDLGNCGSCRGVVYTLTTGLGSPLSDCTHECHLDQVEDEEVAGDLVADLALEREYEDRVWGWSL